jgi:hypothetical protein
MTLTSKRSRHGLLVLVVGVMMTMGFEAVAQDEEAVQKVVELNKKALTSFSNLDVEDAANLLRQALDICAAQHMEQHPAAARTHVHMGVVYVAGLKKRDQGLDEFKKALRIDPNIKVTKSLANPEVQAAFQEAVTDFADAAASAPAPAPTPAPHPVASAPVSTSSGTLVHAPVVEGIAGQPIMVKVQAPVSLAAARVVVAYRAEGAKEYTTHELDVQNGDWYQGQIPAEATSGSMVTYYIVASNDQGQTVAQDGSQSEPHVIALGEGGIINGATSTTVPFDGGERGEGEETSGGSSIWFSLAVGTGFGYHSGQPEANRTNDAGTKINKSGMGWARLLHISPEFGVFVTDSLLLSLQGRFQLVNGATSVKGSEVKENPGACKGGTCHPSTFAAAGLIKATWFLGEPKTVTPFLSLAAGGGQIRHVVSLGSLTGCPKGGCKDTVVGGPILLGAGAGISVELSESLSLVAAVNALMGLPKVMANLDVNLGLAYLH